MASPAQPYVLDVPADQVDLHIATRNVYGEEHVFLLDLLVLLPGAAKELNEALYAPFNSTSVLKVVQGWTQDLQELYAFYPMRSARSPPVPPPPPKHNQSGAPIQISKPNVRIVSAPPSGAASVAFAIVVTNTQRGADYTVTVREAARSHRDARSATALQWSVTTGAAAHNDGDALDGDNFNLGGAAALLLPRSTITLTATMELPVAASGAYAARIAFRCCPRSGGGSGSNGRTYTAQRVLHAVAAAADAIECIAPTGPFKRPQRGRQLQSPVAVVKAPRKRGADSDSGTWAPPKHYTLPAAIKQAARGTAAGLAAIQQLITATTVSHTVPHEGQPYMEVPLPGGGAGFVTRHSYRRFFQLLLWAEEVAAALSLADCDGPATLHHASSDGSSSTGGFVELSVPAVTEGRTKLSRGDTVYITTGDNNSTNRVSGSGSGGGGGSNVQLAYEGTVEGASALNGHTALISAAPQLLSGASALGGGRAGSGSGSGGSSRGRNVGVRFVLGRMPLRLAHQGVVLASESAALTDALLFPAAAARAAPPPPLPRKRVEFFNRRLNSEQQDAVRAVVSGEGTSAPFILFGPPGTGKTTTVVEAILQVLAANNNDKNTQQHRIIVAAPSNTAADELALRLLASDAWPVRSGMRLHRRYAFTRDPALVPPALLPHAARDGAGFAQLPAAALRAFSVVVCTLAAAARLHNQGAAADASGRLFQTMVVDEAGQATEPEALAAVAPLLPLQLVLAGDPRQLGPVVASPLAAAFGLGRSLLERLECAAAAAAAAAATVAGGGCARSGGGGGAAPIVRLVRNYRAHPALLRVPSHLFYGGALVACADARAAAAFAPLHAPPGGGGAMSRSAAAAGLLLNPAIPLVFHGVAGAEMREGRSPSWFSIPEADAVARYAARLLRFYDEERAWDTGEPCTAEELAAEVGIITPYRKQAAKIGTLLARRDARLAAIKASALCNATSWTGCQSVELWQGQERSAIIVSTVRGSADLPSGNTAASTPGAGLGFLTNPRRFNVSATRAKALLVVIGDPALLVRDEHWGALLAFACDHGCYTGCAFDRRLLEGVERVPLENSCYAP
ncbi:P-loop containing nucleoside triphosphate hydrolase protein [Tribonema minus]|uniref:P-loop containing nucleoside triphosphate hydrolase protein n=1 Tax=Tribonema minus TaxID=303371 RepID=A0A836CCK6_9STRA|nr:P-loop containing nucleoside triphosphate hydrolase protein [Tribonema minus]